MNEPSDSKTYRIAELVLSVAKDRREYSERRRALNYDAYVPERDKMITTRNGE